MIKENISSSGTIILGILILVMVPLLYLPIGELLTRCLVGPNGEFVGLKNFIAFFSTPGLSTAAINTLTVGLTVTFITLVLAFIIAYGLSRTNMPCKKIIGSMAMLPALVPSLLPALGLVYLFGEQSPLKALLCGYSLYGPIGIILGEVAFALPHAVILLRIALESIDQNQYIAAASLGAGPIRRFFTITVPNAQYGIISSSVAIFILTITDFGVPKVVGGSFSMLATEIYILVIGQHNFAVGSATSLILLIPTILAVGIDLLARNRQKNISTKRSQFCLEPSKGRDAFFVFGSLAVELPIMATIGIVVLASFVSFWPYDLSLGLGNYDFESIGFSWNPILNSLQIAGATAFFGSIAVIFGTYAMERLPAFWIEKALYRLSMMLPLGLPGTTLGIAYLFAFSRVEMPLSFLYGTSALLIMNCIVHFSTITHMTAINAFTRINPNYEIVGRSLGRSNLYTFFKVVAPISRAAFLDIFYYFFISAMSTVSAVVFLCNGDLMLASVGIIAMNDSGNLGQAAAMGSLILAITLIASLLHSIFRAKFCLWRDIKGGVA